MEFPPSFLAPDTILRRIFNFQQEHSPLAGLDYAQFTRKRYWLPYSVFIRDWNPPVESGSMATALVEYSDSESEGNTTTPETLPKTPSERPAKRPRMAEPFMHADIDGTPLPPLPTEFHDLYATNSRVSVRDEPSLHDGRRRIVPHMEGNWPTHIYLEWNPTNTELSILSDIISLAEDKLGDNFKIHSLLYSDLGARLPLHVSLSRPAVLVTEDRYPFGNLLQTAIRSSSVRPFDVELKGLDWVSNHEITRWFLVLRLNRPTNDGLNRLLRASNQALSVFDQPPLYERPNRPPRKRDKGAGKDPARGPTCMHMEDCSNYFHISIAWALAEPSMEDKNRIASIDLSKIRGIKIRFSTIKMKIGNNVLSLALPTRIVEEKGFSGL